MNKNIGNIDRIIRIVVGLAIIISGVMMNSWIGAIGLIPLITGIVRTCPIYSALKINTCGTNSNKD